MPDEIVKGIAKEIMNSKIIAFTKKLERKLAEELGITFDDERDIWLKQKSLELAQAISKEITQESEE